MKDMTHQFLDWLRSKPADESYDYEDCTGCAFTQFLIASGYASEPSCSAGIWRDKAKGEKIGAHTVPFDDDVLVCWPWTFGAAADRLERALTEQVQ